MQKPKARFTLHEILHTIINLGYVYLFSSHANVGVTLLHRTMALTYKPSLEFSKWFLKNTTYKILIIYSMEPKQTTHRVTKKFFLNAVVYVNQDRCRLLCCLFQYYYRL